MCGSACRAPSGRSGSYAAARRIITGIHTARCRRSEVLMFVEEKMSSTNDGIGVGSRRWVEDQPAARSSGRGWHGRQGGQAPGGGYRAGRAPHSAGYRAADGDFATVFP